MTDPKPTYRYLVLGAGRQGTAAGYDLALFGDASEVVLAEINLAVAESAADRINHLLDRKIARAIQLDVGDSQALRSAMEASDATLSAVTYTYNLAITKMAIETQSHLCDMG